MKSCWIWQQLVWSLNFRLASIRAVSLLFAGCLIAAGLVAACSGCSENTLSKTHGPSKTNAPSLSEPENRISVQEPTITEKQDAESKAPAEATSPTESATPKSPPATELNGDDSTETKPTSPQSLAAGLGKTATEIANGISDPEENSDKGEDEPSFDADSEEEPSTPQFEVADEQTIDFPETWKRLGTNEIWIDMKNKQVILAGYICINVGALEMFACPAGTKEHESVVAVNALPSEMHAALLAIGAKTGAPCSWDDVSFTTASGSKINIDVRWRDEKTNEVITRPAKEMMKIEGKDQLDIDWIFGGSRFHEDLEAKFRSYSANSGEMICVSNFSTAAIDVNIDSSDANGNWLFWANTEKVPPRGTRVYLILSTGDFFEAQRHVFAEAHPEVQKPASQGESEPKEQPPSEAAAAKEPKSEGNQQPVTPPAVKDSSSDKG